MRTSKSPKKETKTKQNTEKQKKKGGATLFFWYKWKMAIHDPQKLKRNDALRKSHTRSMKHATHPTQNQQAARQSIKAAKAIAKARVQQDKAINVARDAMIIACDKPKAEFLKGNAKTNPARGQIKAMFDAICEAGYIDPKARGAIDIQNPHAP
jgi:hypothetical protein